MRNQNSHKASEPNWHFRVLGLAPTSAPARTCWLYTWPSRTSALRNWATLPSENSAVPLSSTSISNRSCLFSGHSTCTTSSESPELHSWLRESCTRLGWFWKSKSSGKLLMFELRAEIDNDVCLPETARCHYSGVWSVQVQCPAERKREDDLQTCCRK